MVDRNLGQNYLTGNLCSSISNLSHMQYLSFGIHALSRTLPKELGNLTDLISLWAFDTKLTGRIPNFIGNWSKLTTLRLEGNSFKGPISLMFANLTSLIDLRISDLTNGSSSLEFIKDMTSLSILVLRNTSISNSIPSNIGEYLKLSQL
ncbi:probable LRR receptor-like serine/threonine-protein kinase At1g56140 [Quercus robur]|uniref:probable LRR receptor-like serine/threonine-protein kinase At1g56140 n=1 Tax=Quercus robur TaxID=38942 RepID=UPI00216358D3|nr:probable LRR receptor-like serine/threonine-protein kinase At1g56140 [Quercus robur]